MKQNAKITREHGDKYIITLIYICLVAAIVAVYWPVYSYNFVKYDDDYYVTNNTDIQSGLNWKSVCWAFTASHSHNWHPATWISHTLDYQLFKTWAGGHHLVNILFHILNTLLLFYVFVRMTGAVWSSAFIAAAFALHPLHVESVAWIAERKDILSTFFWLLTMWAYACYAESPKLKWYLAALILFILGLMSKPMLVTLPFVLLLLDFWPLQRKISWRLLLEKIPFFICSAASCIVTFLVQQRSGATVGIKALALTTRINNAIVSYILYIIKMIWPSRLAVLYPHPAAELSVTTVAVCGLLLVLISIYFIYLARHHRFLAVGWLWYLGTLVPVIGLVQVGAQAMANRYTYMTLTGMFVIIAFSAKEFIPKWRYKNTILASLAVIVLAAWALTAARQVKHWKNSLTLFEYTLQVTEDNPLILESYANCLFEMDRFNEAIEQFNKLLKIKPDSAGAYCNLGCALMWTGKAEQAIEQFKLAIKYKPDYALAYNNLAATLYEQGRINEAADYYRQTLKIKPDFVQARLKFIVILMEMRKFEEAIESCNKMLEIEPANITAHGNLALALAGIGKTDDAIKEVQFVLNILPENAEMHRNLGVLLGRKGDITEAIEAYRTALKIDPNDGTAKKLLDTALKKQESIANK